jgi:hypothetical protein
MVDELDALARDLSLRGKGFSRTDIIQMALEIGMERLRKEGLQPVSERTAKAPTIRKK